MLIFKVGVVGADGLRFLAVFGISFPFLGHKNDNEAVVCSTQLRRYVLSSGKCCDGFS